MSQTIVINIGLCVIAFLLGIICNELFAILIESKEEKEFDRFLDEELRDIIHALRHDSK